MQGASLGWTLVGLLVAFALGWASAAAAARLRHAAALRESRGETQTLMQLLDVWHWQTDAGHRLLRWQAPRGAAPTAWSPAATPGQQLWQRFEPACREPLAERMRGAAPLAELDVAQAQDDPNRRCVRWRLWGLPRLDASGRFAGYWGTARPLDLEQALAAERCAARLLADAQPGPVFVLDAAAPAMLRHANAPARALLNPEALRRADRDELTLADLLVALPAPLRDAVAGAVAGQTTRYESWTVTCRRAEDEPQALSASMLLMLSAPAARPAAAPAGDAASEHAAFSYTVSHDLRAPIRVVEGFARILKEDYGNSLDRIGNDHVDRVLGAAARMNSMIDAMLALSNLSSQPLSSQPVNLSQLAAFVMDDLKREHPGRRVDVRIQPNLSTQGDPTLLRMALENLLGNAWKYSARCNPAEIAFEAVRHNGREAYVVRDNGAGFDMRFADRLFGAFQRLHSANDFAGTGVGLASVRRIVRRHGGEVWAESEVGKGARFYFTLGQ